MGAFFIYFFTAALLNPSLFSAEEFYVVPAKVTTTQERMFGAYGTHAFATGRSLNT